ncbi:MAG: hypothetical protein VYA64_06740, partial [Pseudomonadota bacterium]|nr:hypothetical protein [Pseudomonadota bacterium]
TVCALATDAAAPRLHFMANIDPASFAALFRCLDPARTGVIAISKSGGTGRNLKSGVVGSGLAPGGVGRRGDGRGTADGRD